MLSAQNNPGAGVVTYHLKNPEATVYVGNLDKQATEELVWELMVQAGPVLNLIMPRDKVTTENQHYAFCEFATPEDADYAIRVLNTVKLFGKMLRISRARQEDRDTRDAQGWQAKVFIGNLDHNADEPMLSEIFNSFGALLSVAVLRDAETGASRGSAFLNYDSFESADAAINAMNGQYVLSKPITVAYAFKDSSSSSSSSSGAVGSGERHGSQAERLLAAATRTMHMRIAAPSISELAYVGTNDGLRGNTYPGARGAAAGGAVSTAFGGNMAVSAATAAPGLGAPGAHGAHGQYPGPGTHGAHGQFAPPPAAPYYGGGGAVAPQGYAGVTAPPPPPPSFFASGGSSGGAPPPPPPPGFGSSQMPGQMPGQMGPGAMGGGYAPPPPPPGFGGRGAPMGGGPPMPMPMPMMGGGGFAPPPPPLPHMAGPPGPGGFGFAGVPPPPPPPGMGGMGLAPPPPPPHMMRR